MKEKTLKLSDYFELRKPTYVYIKITPHKSIRNYTSNNIAKAIAHSYKAINKRIYKEQKKIIIETNFKISYIVDIQNNDASFYFLVPKVFLNILLEKIKEIWSKATVEVVEDGIRDFSETSECYSLGYKKEDALSLLVDRKSNEPLNSILNVMEIMKEEDRITIIYNFMPSNQLGWINRYTTTIQKIKEKKTIDKPIMTFDYVMKKTLNVLIGTLDSVLEVFNDFTGGDPKQDKESLFNSILGILEQQNDLSAPTKKKKESTILNTQIMVIGESEDKTRNENNILSVCQSYRVLDEDNELIYKKTKKVPKIEDYDFKVDVNTMSAEEVGNFIQVPGRMLLNHFGIKHINVEESRVPEELKTGVICIGENTYKGLNTKAFLSNDRNYKNLCLAIIGPTRAGKSVLITNISKNCIDEKETVILFDFCGACDISREVSNNIDKNKVLNIDCSNFEALEGMGYNEINPRNDTVFEVYNCAKKKVEQLISFINYINLNNPLEPRMARYLKAAALVVFISGGSFKEVFEVLQDHKIRKEYIGEKPFNQKDNLSEYVTTLEELDEWSKATKDNPSELIGTKIASVQGILNRLDIIKSNSYMELMLKKNCDNNIDIAKEMQKPQLICLKMPEIMFSTDEERDTYCTYWLTKILGALQIRYDNILEKNRTKVNIIFDELYQVPNCQNLLKVKINRIAKTGAKPIISAHSLEQIKYIRSELKSANASYMLIAGCNKDNYNELKEELQDQYELEDLLNLKRYHSLNLIKINDGYSSFITKLPGPI